MKKFSGIQRGLPDIQTLKVGIENCLKSRHGGRILSINNEPLLVYKMLGRIFLFLKMQSLFHEFWRDEEQVRKSIRKVYSSKFREYELEHHKKLRSTTFSRMELKRVKRDMIQDLFDFLKLHCNESSDRYRRRHAHYVAKILIASRIRTDPLKKVEQYLQFNFRTPKRV